MPKLNTWGMSAEEILTAVQNALIEWMRQQGAVRVDIECRALGMWGSRTTHITLPDGERKAMTTPREAAFSVDDLRGEQMIPGRGAWTWAHLWMSADELVLHADYDWDRDVGPADFNCADELERFPRDAQHTPAWLAQGAARGRRATQIYDRLEHALAHWLSTQEDAERIDIDSLALGRRTALRTTLTLTNGTTHHDIDLPDQVTSAITAITTELRGPQTQAKPHAGAWTREQISMETDDLKLVTFYEWDYDPGFTDTDCADELHLHPRDAQHTPTWLAQGAERAHHQPNKPTTP